MTAALINLVCKYCQKSFSVSPALYRQSVERNAPRRFCSRNCSAAVKRMMPVKNRFRQWVDFEEKLRQGLMASHPVITFWKMSPEKQAEIRRLYERPHQEVLAEE